MLKTLDPAIYQDLFAGAKQGLLLVEGERGVVVDANHAAGAVLGCAREDLVGMFFVDVFPGDMRSRISETLDRLWEDEGVSAHACHLADANGVDVPVRLTTSVLVRDDTPYLAVFIRPSARRRGQTRIGESSYQTGGATLTSTLPAPAADGWSTEAADHSAATERAVAELLANPFDERCRNLRVLLAEDNKVNQTVALGMMRKLGHDGTAVDDGRHALMALARGDFDVVFMDLQMPELGGLETTRRIRAGEAGSRNSNIPIIAMTGHATRKDRQACLAAGMNGYIAKPISSDRIAEALDRLSSPHLATDTRGGPFSSARLVAQMNGDTELVAEILGVFREDTTARLTRIAAALRNYAFEDVIHEARAIEGGALNVCADNMVHLARELLRSAERKEQELAESLADEMADEVLAMMLDGELAGRPGRYPA